MKGRDLVAEEALRRGEFVLRLDEASLGGQHRTESCRRVGPEPAATRPDPPRRRLRLLGVTSCGGEPSALDGDERERRAGDHEARDGLLDAGCSSARIATAHASSSSPAKKSARA